MTSPPTTATAFRTMDALLTWLERHGLTLEDAESTMRDACHLTPHGATPNEIADHFATAHDIPPSELGHVETLTAFIAFRRRIHRTKGGRFTAPPPTQTVVALVRVPIDEWPRVRPYAHKGTATFRTDPT